MEEALTYDEPPGWMQPVRHALGTLLIADDRHAEAEEVYRADLRRHPHNAWSLLGLQQSLQKQDKMDEAAALAEQVRRAWANSDVSPVASCYCHPDARGN
ncbi:MAG TPA: tetratricopeptide repeat protein [Planctomycetaceae bacterium]|nr:tetratricopeptide repeat protein [Planctomycetaceae bacterium]